MKPLKLSLWFLFGFLFFGFSVYASAETFPRIKYWVTQAYTTPADVCADPTRVGSSNQYAFDDVTNETATTATCNYHNITSPTLLQHIPVSANYYCPVGATTVQVNSVFLCSATSCTAPDVRSTVTGLCVPTSCQAGTNSTASRYTGAITTTTPGQSTPGYIPIPLTLCDGTCTGTTGLPYACNADSLGPGHPVSCSYDIVLTGATCTGGNGTAPVDPTLAGTNPPCLPGSGSMTSNTTGKVLCVPGATPGATTPPVVTSKSSTATYPDGSTSTTTTTSTCTGVGACSSSTTINNTPATAGGPGAAGTPGTTTKQDDKPAEPSDFCAKNPTLQFCKGGMNEEKTQLKVFEELERFNNPTATDDSSLTSKTFEDSKTQQLTDEDDKLKNTAKGDLTISGVESSKSAWASALQSGFYTPVTLTTCTPIVSNFAGRTWTLDHCSTAEKISNIGAYAMWFMLAIGGFVMLTGGRVS